MMKSGALQNEGGSRRYLIHELRLGIISGRCRVGFELKIPQRLRALERHYCGALNNLIFGKTM